MPDLSRVLLVGPYPGRRWLSIIRYCEAIAGRPGIHGVTITRAAAPWWNPPSIARGLARRWPKDAPFRADRSFPADVVHFADHGLGHHVRRFRDRPTVVTCRDLMPFLLPGFYRSAPEQFVKRSFLRYSVSSLRLATRVIAVSEWTASQLTTGLGIDPRRISVVPNIVAAVYEPAPEPELSLASAGIELPRRPRILSVGHAGAYKNLELTISALGTPALRDAVLVRVGAPLERHQRALAVRLGVQDRIIELGGLASARLAHVYAACDVLAQPSLGEGFGVPVVEAMACGLPVVASNGGALPEVVGEAGLVVPLPADGGAADPRVVASYAGALACVVSDPLLSADLRARGLERAASYRAAEILPQLATVYRKALNGL